ncbi:hypothetical protein HNR46_002146 [Haloferula luteola]|uniref:Glutathionylspermidine synthase n=1 Tax=Haloferula luteola TaxID=595692 RepID=A0A840V0M0_9BACT|nr:hypothetical protein [Haloferula luteola]MBB5351907.1 hypothetical protein [Haloferula luteola]
MKMSLVKGEQFGRRWQGSPQPFVLTKGEVRSLRGMGHVLARFQQSCDEVYRRSAAGSLPPWIAELLDTGKPTWMVELQREAGRQGQLPRVIRPDLMLGERGFSLTELDSVPGGMGLTAWLAKAYTEAGFEVLGGAEGMVEGFRQITAPGNVTVVSEEAGDYFEEMAWLVEAAGDGRGIVKAEDFEQADEVYRFFEWFDWESMEVFRRLAEDSVNGGVVLAPPCVPHLEDKLWLSLFWTPALKPLWQSLLRGSHVQRLREWIPFGWVVDPEPLPPQAALPRLGVHGWEEVAGFSQKERQLVLKISGFHETAWGSRGVYIGHDLSADEWKSQLGKALDDFSQQPWILQEFRETRLVEHPVYDADGEVMLMPMRARLCPYYFTDARGQTELGGCLATLVPADKKKIHGMNDAVLVPCMEG